MDNSTHERFWSKVDKTADCWNWTAATNGAGYGVFRFNGKPAKAHRVSYAEAFGQFAAEMDIDHMCHNPRCVKPGHLRVTTNKQNIENRKGANRNSKSGIRGVTWDPQRGKWNAIVTHHGVAHRAGRFDTIEAADHAASLLRAEMFTHSQN